MLIAAPPLRSYCGIFYLSVRTSRTLPGAELCLGPKSWFGGQIDVNGTIECKTQASILSRLPNRVICECECRILLSHPHVQRHDDLMPEFSPLRSALEFSARKVGPNVYTFQCQSGVQQFALGVWTVLYLWYAGWAHVPTIRCKSLAFYCFFYFW